MSAHPAIDGFLVVTGYIGAIFIAMKPVGGALVGAEWICTGTPRPWDGTIWHVQPGDRASGHFPIASLAAELLYLG